MLWSFKGGELRVFGEGLGVLEVDGHAVMVDLNGVWKARVDWEPKNVGWLSIKSTARGGHDSPPKGYPEERSEYALPASYQFPLDKESRVRSAISYFHKHPFKDSAEKRSAAKRIMRAAKKYDIEVGKEDDVYRAAHSD